MVDDVFSRSVDELAERGRALETELRARNREILALAGIPETGPVTARFDDRGVLSGFAFEPGWRELRDGTQLLAELNNALMRSMFEGAAVGLGGVVPIESATPVAPAAAPAETPEPAVARNAAGTLTVTALLGGVMNLQAEPRWLEQVSDAELSATVGAVADEAAVASDRTGRLRPATDEGNAR